MANRGLHLKAADADDLRTISACVQDALVLVGDISFDPAARRCLIALNRFVWEERQEQKRTVSILTIDNVDAVKYRGIDRAKPDLLLSLLALREVEGGLEMVFSGAAALRIGTGQLLLTLADRGDAWPTLWRPKHPDPDGAAI